MHFRTVHYIDYGSLFVVEAVLPCLCDDGDGSFDVDVLIVFRGVVVANFEAKEYILHPQKWRNA